MTAENDDNIRAQIEKKCLAALARREHSRHELAEKCADFPPPLIAAVLDDLAARGWQDDARFVESYIRSYSGRGQGALKIAQKLKQKGVASALINSGLEAIDWDDIAAQIYRRKYDAAAKTPAERAKRQRFLISRGFTFAQIQFAEKSFTSS